MNSPTEHAGEPSLMSYGLWGLPAALQFLTRVPIRLPLEIPHGWVVPWFPVAGGVIGAAVSLVAWSAASAVSPLAAAALAVVVGLLITGAFHEDGLADMADAFGGGWTPERRLEILKDSRHGTYGVAALASSVVLRVVFLAEAAEPLLMAQAVFAAHVLARAAAVAAMYAFPLAVQSGLGAAAAKAMNPMAFVASIGSGVLLAGLALQGVGVTALVAALGGAAVAALLVGLLAVSKIGGLAGDVLGAIEQVAESFVLIALAFALAA